MTLTNRLWSSMKTGLLLTTACAAGCGGAVADPAPSGRSDAGTAGASDSRPGRDAPPSGAAPTAPTPPSGAAVSCDTSAPTLDYPGLAPFVDALEGLWRSCDVGITALCGSAEAMLFIGTPPGAPRPTPAALTCGRLSTHGSAFIADPDPTHHYTYDVEPSQTNPGQMFAMRVQNAVVDQTFTVALRRPAEANISDLEDVITLARGGDAPVLGLHRAAFTTY